MNNTESKNSETLDQLLKEGKITSFTIERVKIAKS